MRRPTVPDVVLAVSAALLAASSLKNPLRMQDLGIYLVQAESMLREGSLGNVDRWTHTVADSTYVNLTWLAQLAFWAVHRVAGFAGLQTLIAIAAVSTVVITGLAARRVSARSGARAMAGPVCALLIAQNLAMWPELFALPLFAAYAALALTVKPRLSTIAASFVIVALWTNLHGSFPIAPILSGLVALGFALEAALKARSRPGLAAAAALADRERGLLHLATAAAAFAGTLLNPWGIGAWIYVLENAGNSHDWGISEWRATALTDSAGARLAVAWILFWFESRIARRPAHARDVPALLGFTFLALYGLRYVCWIGMILPIALARLFAPPEGVKAPERAPDERELPGFASAAVFVVLAALLVAASPQMRARGAPDEDAKVAAIFHHDANVPLARWAEKAGVRGNVYNPMEWGSWLSWRLGGQGVKTFLDIRLWIFPENVWRDYVLILTAQAGWEDRLAARGVEWLFLSREHHDKLIPYVERSPGWERAYVDRHAVVYRKRGAHAQTPEP